MSKKGRTTMNYLLVLVTTLVIAITLLLSHKTKDETTSLEQIAEDYTENSTLYAGFAKQLNDSFSKVDTEQINLEEEKQDIISASCELNDKITYKEVRKKEVWKLGYINKEKSDVKNQPEDEATAFEQYELNRKIKYAEHDENWARIYYGDGWGYILLKDISDKKIEPKPEPKPQPTYTTEVVYTANQFRRLGSIHWGSRRWTWYSQRVLPGGGLKIPGRHVDENGYVCDEDNYICGASQLLSKGTIIDSPFGKKVKIYDWCDIESVDIYTNW